MIRTNFYFCRWQIRLLQTNFSPENNWRSQTKYYNNFLEATESWQKLYTWNQKPREKRCQKRGPVFGKETNQTDVSNLIKLGEVMEFLKISKGVICMLTLCFFPLVNMFKCFLNKVTEAFSRDPNRLYEGIRINQKRNLEEECSSAQSESSL